MASSASAADRRPEPAPPGRRGPALRRPALRWPAEWEPHAATWLAWPHNPETWPGHLEQARDEFVEILRALQGREALELGVADAESEGGARRHLSRLGVDPDRGIRFRRLRTDDSWLRDTAPVFAERGGADEETRELVAVDFAFDAWGGKYPPWDRDAALGAAIADASGVKRNVPGFVLEGGSIDGDGRGTLLTTAACLLHPSRETGRTREQMEQRLASSLGTRRVIWLPNGIEGDDTDGHVDDVARFVAPGVVVAARGGGSDAAPLEANWRALCEARDSEGRSLDVVALPMPPAHRIGGQQCPASYANFYLANGVALVPTFGAPSDARAIAILGELLEGREIVAVSCARLVQGLGAIHCLTQQQPLPASSNPSAELSKQG